MMIIGKKYGQLGNRLFLYAHLIAAAEEYGVKLMNPAFAEYADASPELDPICGVTIPNWRLPLAHHALGHQVDGSEIWFPRPLSGVVAESITWVARFEA